MSALTALAARAAPSTRESTRDAASQSSIQIEACAAIPTISTIASGSASIRYGSQARNRAAPEASPSAIWPAPITAVASNSTAGSPPADNARARSALAIIASWSPVIMSATDASRNIAAARRGSRVRTRSASRTSRSCAATGEPRRSSTCPRMRSTSAAGNGSSVSAAASSSRPVARSASPQRIGVAGRGQQPPRTRSVLRRQLGRAREVARGGGVRAASAGVERRALELGGHLLVRRDRARGEMPGALGAVGGRGERGVRRAALAQRRRVVDGRAQQRMAELELATGQDDDPRRLGGLQIRQREPRATERVQPPRARRSRQQQRAPRALRQRLDRGRERALDVRARPQRVLERLAPGELARRQQRQGSRAAPAGCRRRWRPSGPPRRARPPRPAARAPPRRPAARPAGGRATGPRALSRRRGSRRSSPRPPARAAARRTGTPRATARRATACRRRSPARAARRRRGRAARAARRGR